MSSAAVAPVQLRYMQAQHCGQQGCLRNSEYAAVLPATLWRVRAACWSAGGHDVEDVEKVRAMYGVRRLLVLCWLGDQHAAVTAGSERVRLVGRFKMSHTRHSVGAIEQRVCICGRQTHKPCLLLCHTARC